MDSLKISNWMLAGLAAALSVTAMAGAQTAAGLRRRPQHRQRHRSLRPVQLQNLGQTTKADPFPPANPKYFTALSPTVRYGECVFEGAVGV